MIKAHHVRIRAGAVPMETKEGDRKNVETEHHASFVVTAKRLTCILISGEVHAVTQLLRLELARQLSQWLVLF